MHNLRVRFLLHLTFATGVKAVCQEWVSEIRTLKSSFNNMTDLASLCDGGLAGEKKKIASFLLFPFQLSKRVRPQRETFPPQIAPLEYFLNSSVETPK